MMKVPAFKIEEFEPLVQQIGDQLKSLLAGKNPALQSAVLADLTAMWVVGQCATKIEGKIDVAALSSRETRRLRRRMLQDHVDLIHHFMRINADYMIKHFGELPKYTY
jgi:hypothetical protein